MQSPYQSNNPKKRQLTSNDLKKLQMTSKDVSEKDKPVSKKVKTKNILKRVDQKDDKPTQGRDLLEQAFSSQ